MGAGSSAAFAFFVSRYRHHSTDARWYDAVLLGDATKPEKTTVGCGPRGRTKVTEQRSLAAIVSANHRVGFGTVQRLHVAS